MAVNYKENRVDFLKNLMRTFAVQTKEIYMTSITELVLNVPLQTDTFCRRDKKTRLSINFHDLKEYIPLLTWKGQHEVQHKVKV